MVCGVTSSQDAVRMPSGCHQATDAESRSCCRRVLSCTLHAARSSVRHRLNRKPTGEWPSLPSALWLLAPALLKPISGEAGKTIHKDTRRPANTEEAHTQDCAATGLVVNFCQNFPHQSFRILIASVQFEYFAVEA